MTINEAIDLLKSYNGPLKLTLHAGASEELIKKVESTYSITLPDDFKTFYRFADGFETAEDIFNMTPLTDIAERYKSYDKRFDIAEYMIYSDMWELEVNPGDPNDYAIFNVDGEKGKIILTKSLAEFISRFLKGGVFEVGGLYAWRDEIKAKLHGNTNPDKIKPLLGVFREGLKLGLISKQEIVRRADWIISTEYEPDYFFIEISLSRDLNELLEVLNSMHIPEDILHLRVVFGVIHMQLLIDKITSEEALSILRKLIYQPGFTRHEKIEMYSLTDYFDEELDEKVQRKLDQQVKDFFENYAQFNLYNYKNWYRINAVLVKRFEIKELEQGFNYHPPYKTLKSKSRKLDKRKLKLVIGLFLLVAILSIIYYFDPTMLPTAAIIFIILFSRNYARFRRR